MTIRRKSRRRGRAGGVPKVRVLRQRKYRERPAEFGVVAQLSVAADCTESVGILLEPRRHADAGPAADARVNADVLLALVLVREHVADDARRRLELEKLLVDVI